MKEQFIHIDAHGNKFYYSDKSMSVRFRHREDGPAIEWTDGSKAWYINGERHREDGPAIVDVDGYREWWVNGNHLTEDKFNDRNNVEFTLDEIAEKLGVSVDLLKIKK